MVSIRGSVIAWTHTVCAASAFIAALVVGYTLHFEKIVANAWYRYPDEWFPSVSATIGDRYPERSIFQILIALTALPRFLLLFTHYYLNRSLFTLLVGIVRTITCGGWVYITSTDDHDAHDVFMISYIVLTIPWDYMIIKHSQYKEWKKILMTAFFGTLIPLIYWFIQHQVHRRAGAYSVYAYFEWSLIVLDIAFDALACQDFDQIKISVSDWSANEDENIVVPTEYIVETEEQVDITVTETVEEKLNDSSVEELSDDENIQQEHSRLLESNDNEITILLKETEDIMYPNDLPVPPSQDSFMYIIVNTFNSFMFWTTITSLFCMLWHFPLWYMGISGYEAVILSTLSPVFLYIPLVTVVVDQYGMLLANVFSIGAFFIDTPETRLLTVALATALIVMTFALNLNSLNSSSIGKFSLTWIMGLILSVVVKMGFFTNNPLWAIMNENNGGLNIPGLVVSTLFALITPFTNSCHLWNRSKTTTRLPFFRKLLVSTGFGSLVFAIHQSLTDASTLIYWCWEGWNSHKGPLAWPWAGLVCVAMIGGALTGKQSSRTISMTLAISTLALTVPQVKEWFRFLFGVLPYVVSIIWIIPSYFELVNYIQSPGFLSYSFFIYILFVLAHVWTVAYAFVPYGWILREKLPQVLCFSTTLILAGLIEFDSFKPYEAIAKSFTKKIRIVAVGLLLLTGVFTYQIRPTLVPEPYHPEANLITAGIWTIHFGFDNDLWASEDRMTHLIKDMQLDIVGLLETDTQRITTGNRDLTAKMAHDLGMYADFGPGPNKHTWGCVLLSKFPIIKSEHHLLPSPVGELAPAIHATIEAYGELVDVFVFHSGQEEDEEDRRLQSEAMAELMGSTNRPSILLSYLVTKPHQDNYNVYVSDKSQMYDIDPTDEDRWCEYILYKKLKRAGYARVSRATITDTELQVAKFQVLPDIDEVDEDYLYGYRRLPTKNVHRSFKFPKKFMGDGERGHHYHVFDEPRYFN
ncbi:Cwh43 [Kluyveromyces lactis]|nr:Cwh43 [Kluyveromyces lactis]